MRLLQTIRKTINTLLEPIGIEVIKTKSKVLNLRDYPEKERPAVPQYINIGAGDFYHPFWHNVDMPNDYYADRQRGRIQIQYDLTSFKPIPFSNNSVRVAYTSHVIEHLRDEHVQHLFREVFRALKPGGYFRITCPDIDLELDAYRRGDNSFWTEPNAYGIFNSILEQCFLDHFASALTMTHPSNTKSLTDVDVQRVFATKTKEDALNCIVDQIPIEMRKGHPGDHVNWFNCEKIIRMLKEAQFEEIYESRYGQSHCAILRNTRLFDYTCPGLSLYVECRKPEI